MSQARAGWRVALLTLPLLALFVVHPLIVNGCSCGHDFDFHVLSWLEAATQIAHGNLHPQWAFTPAYDAGEPRFVFYPPLSWEVGAALGLALPWTWSPIVFTWLALTGAGLSCFVLLREFVPAGLAVAVSALYMVNPYTMFTAFERTAYAELLCAAWFPLLLHAIVRERVTVPRVALPVALLWLSNAPAAVLGCYSLGLLAAVRLVGTVRRGGGSGVRLAGRVAAGTALGIGLASFYIVPAAVERRSIEAALDRAQSLLVTQNFLFGHTADADHDAVLRTASLLAVGMLGGTAVALGVGWWRRLRGEGNEQQQRRNAGVSPPRDAVEPHRSGRDDEAVSRSLAIMSALTVAIAFLLTKASAAIWLHAPQLAFLQFPWRFLAILAPTLALALAIAVERAPVLLHAARRYAMVVLMVVVCGLGVGGYGIFHQECDPQDTVAARVAMYRSGMGTEATDEYTPAAADNDLLGKTNPPFWLAAWADAPAPTSERAGVLRGPVDVSSPVAQMLILNLREFPAWRLTLNHHLVTNRVEREDGLMAVPVAAGASHLEIAYARTPDRTAGWIVSAVSLVVLAILVLRRRRSG